MGEFTYDVVIIGAGVIGAAIAREIARYQLRTCVIEKEEDVCSGTSKANSAIVHAGYDAETGTLKARLNLEGNRKMEALSKELDFDFQRNGSLVLCFSEDDIPDLHKLYERGISNGVPGLKLLTGDEARILEPNLTDQTVAAILAPTGGIVCPFGLTIALAENAFDNGVEFRFDTTAELIQKLEQGFLISTSAGELSARYVVNAAGVYSDLFHNMVSEEKIHITPRRGEYLLLDKEVGGHVAHTIFQLPGKLGKGVLVTPTVHGNLLIGPTATDIKDREDISTSASDLELIQIKSAAGVKDIPFRQVITSFAGLRAHEDGDDFIIGEVKDAPGFYDVAGIESPGLSCAPAIGEYVAKMIADQSGAAQKENYQAVRKGFVHMDHMTTEERAKLIEKRPEYGTIICRCENVSEGQIIDAINRSLGAVSLDGIKRRVRTGSGRCQAGFCTPRTMELLARERGISIEEVCKNAPGSQMLDRN